MKKYQIVSDKITNYIKEKGLVQGDKIPKIDTLIEMYGVSKATIIQALSLLAQKGIVYKVQGSGIFVRRPSISGYISLTSNRGFGEVLDNENTKVLKFEEIELPEKERKLMRCDEKSLCYHVVRLHFYQDKPVVLESSYFLKEYIPFLSKDIAKGSIFKFIEEGLNTEIRFSDKYIEVKKLTAEQADLLQLEEGDPALEVNDVYYLAKGQIFNCSKLIYNYQNSKFFDQSPDELIQKTGIISLKIYV